MELLFTTTEDLRAHLDLQFEFEFDRARKFIRQAQRTYLVPVLGEAFLAELIEGTSSSGSGEGEDLLDEVTELAKDALGQFTGMLMVPVIQLQMGDAGLHVTAGEHYKTPYQWQIGNYKEALHQAGMAALEELYRVLEENASTFTTWRESTAFSQYNALLLRNAAEFDQHYSIGANRVTYVDLVPAIKRAEQLHMRRMFGATFYDSLIDHLQSEESGSAGEGDTMLDLVIGKLRPALAHFAISEAKELHFRHINGALISTRYNGDATNKEAEGQSRSDDGWIYRVRTQAISTAHQLLATARSWMDENAADIPGYTASPAYREEGTEQVTIEERIHNYGGIVGV
jgi:hypothetical protein